MLTDIQARKAKPKDRDYKLADSGGLHLYVHDDGVSVVEMEVLVFGKEKRLVFGPSPEVSLSEARGKRDAAKRQLREHLDPAVELLKARAAAAANHAATFEAIARKGHEQ